MKILPTSDRILVQRCAADEKTPGGIILPDNAQEKSQKVKVRAIGPGKYSDIAGKQVSVESLVGHPISEGSLLLISKYGGSEIDGMLEKDLLMIRADDVQGVLR